MLWTRKLRLRLRSLFGRPQVERDLEDELRDYIELEIQREIAAGSRPDEARRRALMSLRGGERLKEECRDARGIRWLEDIAGDLRFTLRSMRRAPIFAGVVVAALALCIGANTAIFSVVDTVLFRPLPFPHQDRLVSITEGLPSMGFPVVPASPSDYLFISAHNRFFASTGTYRTHSYEISGVGEPRHVDAARITWSLFDVLQVHPVLGREFTKEEDESAKPVAVLGYGFAGRLFAEPERAIGRTIHIDRKPYTVIGVMPRSFSFPPRGLQFSGTPAEVFVPVSWSQEDRQGVLNNFDYNMLARLRPQAAVPQAASDVRRLLKIIAASYPPEVIKFLERVPNFSLESKVGLFREDVIGNVQRPLLLLLAAVGVVLLIGCADVANLMFSRMVGRQREFALRSALGAGSWRLARQTLTEGLVLSLTGGLIGFCLAFWALPLLLRLAPENLPRLNEVGLDWRVTSFVVVVSLATPLFFCLAPLLEIVRPASGRCLRVGGRSNTPGKRQRLLMSGAVVTQFTLAFLLLTTAGLLVRSFIKASEANPGFRPEHLVSVRVDLPSSAYSEPTRVTSFFDRLLAQLSSLPGVQQTGAVSDLPMGATSNNILTVEGNANPTRKVETIYCTGNALQSLGVVLVRGRLLQPGDESKKQLVVVVSETMSRLVWPHDNALGKRLKFGGDGKEPWMTVVGVVKDVKDKLTSSAPRSMMFTTRADWVNAMNVLVRTSGDPLSLAGAIRQRVHQLDPSLPAGELETLDDVLDKSLSAERFRTWLLASFALTALLLAMLGIAGLLAYNTAQRMQEFGVRVALGAERRDLLLLVVKQSLRLSTTGIALGLLASIFMTRALSALLYDTSRYDVGTFLAVPSLLALVAFGASLLPAWRAAHMDPTIALKIEY